MLWTILIILLVLALLGGFAPFGTGGGPYYGYGMGYGGGGLLIVLLILFLVFRGRF